MKRLGRILCWFGFHKTDRHNTGYGFDGMIDYWCLRCTTVVKRVPLDDADIDEDLRGLIKTAMLESSPE
jgi:hypothetical protein